MPLPLGHAVIGLTTHNLCAQDNSVFRRRSLAVFVIILANLPDIDVLIGLFLCGNGNAFHRGPTHSLMFALVMGYLASNAWKLLANIPKISFKNCSLLVLSHVVADYFFTASPVSFFWPFELNWSIGYAGWGDVVSSVFLKIFRDAEIILGCAVVIIINLLIDAFKHPTIDLGRDPAHPSNFVTGG